jgi:hypothetical protein
MKGLLECRFPILLVRRHIACVVVRRELCQVHRLQILTFKLTQLLIRLNQPLVQLYLLLQQLFARLFVAFVKVLLVHQVLDFLLLLLELKRGGEQCLLVLDQHGIRRHCNSLVTLVRRVDHHRTLDHLSTP